MLDQTLRFCGRQKKGWKFEDRMDHTWPPLFSRLQYDRLPPLHLHSFFCSHFHNRKRYYLRCRWRRPFRRPFRSWLQSNVVNLVILDLFTAASQRFIFFVGHGFHGLAQILAEFFAKIPVRPTGGCEKIRVNLCNLLADFNCISRGKATANSPWS